MRVGGVFVPKLSLPVRLALLVAGTTLPLILFAAGIILRNYEEDRSAARLRVLETVRSIRLVLDAEVQRMTGGLQVLALTNSLRNGEFESFRPHRARLSRPVWQGRRDPGRRPRRTPAVLLGHGGHREPAGAQQPRHRREGVRDQTAAIFRPVHRGGEETTDPHRRGAGDPRRQGDLRDLLQSADRHVPEHRGEATPGRRLDHLDFRSSGPPFRARAESGRHHRPARLADALRGDGQSSRSDAADGIAGRRQPAHSHRAILAHGMDGRGRHFAELAGRTACGAISRSPA